VFWLDTWLRKTSIDELCDGSDSYSMSSAAPWDNPPEQRRLLRQRLARPIMDDLAAFLDASLATISGRSELAKAIRYARSRAALLVPQDVLAQTADRAAVAPRLPPPETIDATPMPHADERNHLPIIAMPLICNGILHRVAVVSRRRLPFHC
jgi:hypothetical protein